MLHFENLFFLMFVLFIMALSWWKILWSLLAFVSMVPLASGLQVLGFVNPIPIADLLFASIYLSWLSKRLFYLHEDLSPAQESVL